MDDIQRRNDLAEHRHLYGAGRGDILSSAPIDGHWQRGVGEKHLTDSCFQFQVFVGDCFILETKSLPFLYRLSKNISDFRLKTHLEIKGRYGRTKQGRVRF